MKGRCLEIQSLMGYNYGVNFDFVNAGQLQYTIQFFSVVFYPSYLTQSIRGMK